MGGTGILRAQRLPEGGHPWGAHSSVNPGHPKDLRVREPPGSDSSVTPEENICFIGSPGIHPHPHPASRKHSRSDGTTTTLKISTEFPAEILHARAVLWTQPFCRKGSLPR